MSRRKDYSDFDIVSFLEDQEIYHRFTGKNVGKNYVGFRCPFCGGDGEHGGVNLTHKNFSCWQCAESASPPKLIKQILNCSWSEAYRIVEEYSENKSKASLDIPIPCQSHRQSMSLPALAGPLTGPGGLYLKSRGFDPKFIEAKYGVKEVGPLGDYRFRLIIPIYLNNKLVSFTTRDYTEKAAIAKLDQPIPETVIPVKDCIYNIDTVREKILIVEGPADVWRMGDGCGGLFGNTCSLNQLKILFHLAVHMKILKAAVILLDPKTQRLANKLYYQLVSFIPEVRIVDLFNQDPAKLTQQEAMNLKLQIF